jgi:carbon storage regulator
MLVLTRKQGERLQIGNDVTITVLEVQGRRIRLGIEAPHSTRIMRSELPDWDRPTREPARREVELVTN